MLIANQIIRAGSILMASAILVASGLGVAYEQLLWGSTVITFDMDIHFNHNSNATRDDHGGL